MSIEKISLLSPIGKGLLGGLGAWTVVTGAKVVLLSPLSVNPLDFLTKYDYLTLPIYASVGVLVGGISAINNLYGRDDDPRN